MKLGQEKNWLKIIKCNILLYYHQKQRSSDLF